ncbi:MAG: histidine phosphatase family protein [Chloroflexi bacterium]|nr:histidine phosphatase family protein [Chloroflexota bacterium]
MPPDRPETRIWLLRHGETTWARDGRHTSVSEIPLTDMGEAAARVLAPLLARQAFRTVLTSPRVRARATARLAGFPDAAVDEDLAEWAYGDYEGLTGAEIQARDPGWTIWERGAPGGESPAEVTARLDRLIERLVTLPGPVLCVGHGHCFRALGARWIGAPVTLGASLALGTTGLSILGVDRGERQLTTWNATPDLLGA